VLIERTVVGRTVRAECAERNRRRAASAIGAFEPAAVAGDVGPGTQIRFGWSMLRLIEDGDGLRVTEPDFWMWPEQQWSRSIDVTLDVTAAQVRLLAAVEADGEDAWFDQALVAARGAIQQRGVFLRRVTSVSEEDSGWLLGALNDPEALADDDRLERWEIASLVAARSTLLQVLTLPRGFVAIVVGDSIERVLDGAGNERLAGGRYL
jgi:hypothetical protein